MKYKGRFLVTRQKTGFHNTWTCHTCQKRTKVVKYNKICYEWQVDDMLLEEPNWWFCSEPCVNMYILSKI